MSELSREEQIEVRMQVLGISRIEAEFITAIELGEISGDVIAIDAQGNEMPHSPPEPTQ